MRKTIFSLVVGTIILLLGIYISNLIIDLNKTEITYNNESLTSVYAQKISNKSNSMILNSSGKLISSKRINLFSEVSGIVKVNRKKKFKEGNSFKKNEILVEIISDEYYATVQQSRSELKNKIASILPLINIDFKENFDNWNKYFLDLDVNKEVKPLPIAKSEKENLFISAKSIESQYFNVKNKEERLKKYIIKAPFNGTIIKSNINEGSFISLNQQIGQFIDPEKLELELSISSKYYDRLSLKNKIEVFKDDKKTLAPIKRINKKIDELTQTVSVFVEFKSNKFKDGEFVEANINLGNVENSYLLSRSLLVNDEFIYGVSSENSIVKINVEPIFYNKNSAIVKGIEDDTYIITEFIPDIYEGMKVKIIDK